MVSTLSDDLALLSPLGGHLAGANDTRVAVYGKAETGFSPVAWVEEHHAAVLEALHEYGAVLVRGAVRTPELLEAVAKAVGGDLLEYTERTTPRSTVSGNVYTSTEYPANQTIPQHNELSYSNNAPRWLFFACALPSESGGATPLADSSTVLNRLPEPLVDRFRERGVLYTRAYKVGMGLTWREAFQVENRSEVEEYCRRNGMEFEWCGDGELRTRSRRPAVLRDPRSGKEVWFNQAHLFHVSSLPTNVRAALVGLYEEKDYPRHSYYGDGTPIAEEDLEAIRQAYDDSLFETPWHDGDLLIVNNLLTSHGRRPYEGSRRVLVAMAGVLDIAHAEPSPVVRG